MVAELIRPLSPPAVLVAILYGIALIPAVLGLFHQRTMMPAVVSIVVTVIVALIFIGIVNSLFRGNNTGLAWVLAIVGPLFLGGLIAGIMYNMINSIRRAI